MKYSSKEVQKGCTLTKLPESSKMAKVWSRAIDSRK